MKHKCSCGTPVAVEGQRCIECLRRAVIENKSEPPEEKITFFNH